MIRPYKFTVSRKNIHILLVFKKLSQMQLISRDDGVILEKELQQ